MAAWDQEIFAEEANIEFLDELDSLDDDGVVDAVRDACLQAVSPGADDDEVLNGLAAATIAAIWAGAPFSASDVAEQYPFIRDLSGSVDESLAETAGELLEEADTEADVDPFIEALS